MFKNYLKIALRNLLRHKGFSFINIFGLAVGLTVCILILLWVQFQLNADRFHDDVENIHMVLAHGTMKNNPSTPAPLAPALKDEIPEILYSTRYDSFPEILLSYRNKSFYENRVRAVDPAFFKIFSFPFSRGNPDSAMKDIRSLVITETIAEKYFSGEDPIGKVLTLNNQREFVVTGVLKNMPSDSNIRFDIAIPYEIRILDNRERGWEMDWDSFSPRTFVKLKPNTNFNDINQKIVNFLTKHNKEEDATLSLLPFSEINFFFSDTEIYIYIFSAIAILILLIACINFMNLSTSRSSSRAKEIGIRKVGGAEPRSIIKQFLAESILTSFIALLLSLLFVELLMPVFNSITGIEYTFNPFSNPLVILALIALAILTGVLAGGYPAFFLSSIQTIKVLQGNLKSGSRGSKFRKILVTVQFSISIVLIIGTMVITKQLNYFKNRDIGYDRDQVVSISLKGESQKFYQRLKEELLRNKNILSVSGCVANMPYFWWSSGTASWKGKDPQKDVLTANNIVDFGFVETLKIKLVQGRNFSEQFSSDIKTNFLINEKMAEIMKSKSPLNTQLTYWGKTGKVVGVMKNFNFKPLDTQIEPLVLILDPQRVSTMLIRLPTENISSSLGQIEKIWNKMIPMYPFTYSFLDEDFNRRYRGIERFGSMGISFTIIAILVACLGLFGLASYVTAQRSKEIGIRKVLGASVPRITLLLSTEFFRCVVIANLIAWPLAYIFMNKWLYNFAFRTTIDIWIFVLAGILSLSIALFTVSYQSIRSASSNPVDTLRYE